MGERVAVIGSREGVDLSSVEDFMRRLRESKPDTLVVSGGARGVDTTAEQVWISLGGSVVSLRPREESPGRWIVERFEFGGGAGRCVDMTQEGEPSFGDFASAAYYRNLLIAEKCDRCVAFIHQRSRGATHCEWSFREVYGKPTHLYES